MSQPVHFDEMKGSAKLWLRHHAEFLPFCLSRLPCRVDTDWKCFFFPEGRKSGVRVGGLFSPTMHNDAKYKILLDIDYFKRLLSILVCSNSCWRTASRVLVIFKSIKHPSVKEWMLLVGLLTPQKPNSTV